MRFPFEPALMRSLRAGYTGKDFAADLGAGLLVGVVALPLSMAFAIASNCKPEQGLFTAIIAGGLISLLGGSRVQIGGPTGAFVVLCAAAVTKYGYGGLALATLMADVILLLIGLFRLGRAIAFIPTPVVIGFTSGIAVVIASTQLKEALGLSYDGNPGEFVERIRITVGHLSEWNWHAAALCVGTVLAILALRKVSAKLPGALIAIVIGTLIVWYGDLHVATIQSKYQTIPNMLPKPGLPDFGLGDHWTMSDLASRMYDLTWLAIAVALLGAIESLLSAVVADGMCGDRHDSDTELIAQGVANLASPLFGGLPATGAIARTATNIRAGARSPVAGLVHAAALFVIMWIAAPLAVHIPMASLAGVLLVVCWNMAEVRHWPHILKAKRSDAFLLPTAFLLTVFVDLTTAVVIGTLLAMLFFVKRMADVTTAERVEPSESGVHRKIPAGVEVYEVNGPFFFGAASMIRDLVATIGKNPKVLILHIPDVPFIDGTATFAIRDLWQGCRRRGIELMMSGVAARPYGILESTGLADEIGKHRIFAELEPALEASKPLVAE